MWVFPRPGWEISSSLPSRRVNNSLQEIQHFYLTFVLFSTHLHSLEAFTEIFLSVIWGIIWGRIKLNTICYVCNTNLFCLNKEFVVLFHFLIIIFVGKEFSYQRNVSPLLQTQELVSRKVWSSLFGATFCRVIQNNFSFFFYKIPTNSVSKTVDTFCQDHPTAKTILTFVQKQFISISWENHRKSLKSWFLSLIWRAPLYSVNFKGSLYFKYVKGMKFIETGTFILSHSIKN